MNRDHRFAAAMFWGMCAFVLTFLAGALVVPAEPRTRVDDGEVVHLKGGFSRPWLAFAFVGLFGGTAGAVWRYTRLE